MGICAHRIIGAAATGTGRLPLVFTIGERNLMLLTAKKYEPLCIFSPCSTLS
jgi:hypothetical protein